MDLYDNLDLLLSIVKSLFHVIEEATEGHEQEISEVASLGGYLCVELERRAKLLLDEPDYETQLRQGQEE